MYWDPSGNAGSSVNVSTGLGLGGAGIWDTSSSLWYNPNSPAAPVAWSNGDTAVFNGQTGEVLVSGTVTAANVTFQSPNYKIVGGTLNIAPTDSSQGVIETDAASATISSHLVSNAAGWVRQGSGALLLTATNNTSGTPVTVQGGGPDTQSGLAFDQPGALPPTTVLQIGSGGYVCLGKPTLYTDTAGTTEDWNTDDIWHLGGVGGPLTTWIDGSDAVLGGSNGGTLDISAPVDANSVTFDGGGDTGYTIASDAAGDTLNVPTITVNMGASTVNPSATDGSGLAVNGPGTLDLTAANNYTGTTTISGTTVVAGNDAAFGDENP